MNPAPPLTPFVLADYRRTNEVMATLPLKLPSDAITQLQAQADWLRCNRGALARTLIIRGLEQLQETTTAPVATGAHHLLKERIASHKPAE